MAYRATRRASACVTKASQGKTMYSKSNCTTAQFHRHHLVRRVRLIVLPTTPPVAIWAATTPVAGTSNSTSASSQPQPVNAWSYHKRAALHYGTLHSEAWRDDGVMGR